MSKQIIAYKIILKKDADIFNKDGVFYGNERDILDGYMHMCGEMNQITRLINKYYLGKPYYIYELKFTENEPINNIRFELSNGIMYPHLYNRPLVLSDVISQSELKIDL